MKCSWLASNIFVMEGNDTKTSFWGFFTLRTHSFFNLKTSHFCIFFVSPTQNLKICLLNQKSFIAQQFLTVSKFKVISWFLHIFMILTERQHKLVYLISYEDCFLPLLKLAQLSSQEHQQIQWSCIYLVKYIIIPFSMSNNHQKYHKLSPHFITWVGGRINKILRLP